MTTIIGIYLEPTSTKPEIPLKSLTQYRHAPYTNPRVLGGYRRSNLLYSLLNIRRKLCKRESTDWIPFSIPYAPLHMPKLSDTT